MELVGSLATLVGLGLLYAIWDLVEAVQRQRDHLRIGTNGLGEIVARGDVRCAKVLVAMFGLFLISLLSAFLPFPRPHRVVLGQMAFILMTATLVLHVAILRTNSMALRRYQEEE